MGTARARDAVAGTRGPVTILKGFPEVLEGELLFCHQDNLNTDGIYPGKIHLRRRHDARAAGGGGDGELRRRLPDDRAKGRHSRRRLQLRFGQLARTGGHRAEVSRHRPGARRFVRETYKRNAINNGFLVIECPRLVTDLRAAYAGVKDPTIRTDWKARIDFESSTIAVGGKTYTFAPLRGVAQELVALGGFESVLRHRIAG